MKLHRLKKKDVVRSDTYRRNFIREHPGFCFAGKHWYMCTYCGRIITQEKMQVDHVLAIDLARRNRIYRMLAPSLEEGGINGMKNLRASCPRCNSQKSNNGGWWLIKGHIGNTVYTIVWIITIAIVCCVLILVLFGIWTPEKIRMFVETSISHTLSSLTRYAASFFSRVAKAMMGK